MTSIEDLRSTNRQALYEWISRRWWDPRQHDLVADGGGSLTFKFSAGTTTVSLDAQIDDLKDSYLDWVESPLEVFDTDLPTHFFVYFRHGYGRSMASGSPRLHECEFLLLYVVENGKVAEIVEYFNPLEALSAAGRDVAGVTLLRDEKLPASPFS